MLDRSVMPNGAGLGRDHLPEGRRVLDLAQGILLGFRRYRTEAAFKELVSVAHKHDVSVSAVASALVALATGTTDETRVPGEALVVAELAWGDQFDGPVGGAFGEPAVEAGDEAVQIAKLGLE